MIMRAAPDGPPTLPSPPGYPARARASAGVEWRRTRRPRPHCRDGESTDWADLAADRADPGVRLHLLPARCVALARDAQLVRHEHVRARRHHRLVRRLPRPQAG